MTNAAETRLAVLGMCGRGSDSCYIISQRLICLWSRVVFVWTGSESHFLFTSTRTHPWSFSLAFTKTGSRVSSTSGLAHQAEMMACANTLPNHDTFPVAIVALKKPKKKKPSTNQPSKYSPSVWAALPLQQTEVKHFENTVPTFKPFKLLDL